MTKSCSKGVLMTERWGEHGCDCQGPAGIAVGDGDTAPAGIGAAKVGGGRRNLRVQAE